MITTKTKLNHLLKGKDKEIAVLSLELETLRQKLLLVSGRVALVQYYSNPASIRQDLLEIQSLIDDALHPTELK